MVIGELKVVKTSKVKNNYYYGDYEIVDTFTHRIVNEKYEKLVSPENGIHIMVESIDGDKLDITVSKYAFTGEEEKYCDKDTEFSTSFCFAGHVYEIAVNARGQLASFDEWYSISDFEDSNEPDNHYKAKSNGIKWEVLKQ